MKRLGLLLVAFLFAASARCMAQAVAMSRPASDRALLMLSPGDVLKIDVWQQKEYSCECFVSEDGSLNHPLYKELKVTGLPLSEVEARLRGFLARYLSTPTFDLQPLLRVVVAGEVRQPNIYSVPPGTSVAQAVFLAGGPTERGKLEDVRLIRGLSTQSLDLTRPDASTVSLEVHSGDQILIGRRRSVMQDVIAPSSSILAALAAITSVIIQVTR